MVFSALAAPPPTTEYMPAALLQLDPMLSHHVILVEKHSHRLMVYENQDTFPVLLKSYTVATGKYSGDKKTQGDKKTPEGVFLVTDFRSSQELKEAYGQKGAIYGAGAFVLNYPTPLDLLHGKTGSGIWLHSTNDNARVSVGTDSRGCVVTIDQDLADISRFVELNKTPLIITQSHYSLPRASWLKRRQELREFVAGWAEAWKNEEFDRYIAYYHPQNYSDSFRKTFQQFKRYKQAVFARPGRPIIEISNISIIGEKNFMVVRLIQNYQAPNLSDTGAKTLYLAQDNSYQWKIIHETWSRLAKTPEQEMVFTPSQRFFTQQAKN